MTCRACHFDHPPTQRCEVARRIREAASNTASNNVIASNTAASNSESASNVILANTNPVERKQRWSKDAYNNYMREYMKRKRAK